MLLFGKGAPTKTDTQATKKLQALISLGALHIQSDPNVHINQRITKLVIYFSTPPPRTWSKRAQVFLHNAGTLVPVSCRKADELVVKDLV